MRLKGFLLTVDARSPSGPLDLFATRRAPLRGFLLTVDALLALALISSAVVVTAAYSNSDDVQDVQSLNVLARDYLELRYGSGVATLDEAKFAELTGLRIDESAPLSGRVVVHDVFYNYSAVCGGAAAVAKNNLCLAWQDTSLYGFKYGVWVSP